MIIVYDAFNGIPIRDGEVENYIEAIISANSTDDGATLQLTFATENIILGLRVAIKEQRIPYQALDFRFQQDGIDTPQFVIVNVAGEAYAPAGFCDTSERYLIRLL